MCSRVHLCFKCETFVSVWLTNFKELAFEFLSRLLYVSYVGSIKLLSSQAVLVLRSKRRRSTNGRTEKSLDLSTTNATTDVGSFATSLVASIRCCSSCSQAGRTRSRCLLITHLIYSKHTYFAFSLSTSSPFVRYPRNFHS